MKLSHRSLLVGLLLTIFLIILIGKLDGKSSWYAYLMLFTCPSILKSLSLSQELACRLDANLDYGHSHVSANSHQETLWCVLQQLFQSYCLLLPRGKDSISVVASLEAGIYPFDTHFMGICHVSPVVSTVYVIVQFISKINVCWVRKEVRRDLFPAYMEHWSVILARNVLDVDGRYFLSNSTQIVSNGNLHVSVNTKANTPSIAHFVERYWT